MAQSSSHEMSSVSCAPPLFGRFSCNIEVEDDKSSMEEPEVKDDKSSMEEPEVKLGGGDSRRGMNQKQRQNTVDS